MYTHYELQKNVLLHLLFIKIKFSAYTEPLKAEAVSQGQNETQNHFTLLSFKQIVLIIIMKMLHRLRGLRRGP
jgi:hypothetical protein